jgi:hypothetical protein
MNYIHTSTGETIVAYEISSSFNNGGNYVVSFQENGQTVGLFPEQTQFYSPVAGDFYIDVGTIADSGILDQAAFRATYQASA